MFRYTWISLHCSPLSLCVCTKHNYFVIEKTVRLCHKRKPWLDFDRHYHFSTRRCMSAKRKQERRVLDNVTTTCWQWNLPALLLVSALFRVLSPCERLRQGLTFLKRVKDKQREFLKPSAGFGDDQTFRHNFRFDLCPLLNPFLQEMPLWLWNSVSSLNEPVKFEQRALHACLFILRDSRSHYPYNTADTKSHCITSPTLCSWSFFWWNFS